MLVHAAEAADPLGALKAGHFENWGRTMRFDAVTGVAGPRLAFLLSIVRCCYDRVERIQDVIVRARRSRRAGP